ncbi:MAG: ATP-binding protein [Armatimonadetes bacterium]|nr:ATP-binding protein [Armatimonadota bacterium]
MSTSAGAAVVEMTIPARPEYVGVARLAILGVASRMRFSYDEVEDIRLAVGEACANAIERMNRPGSPGATIRLRCLVEPQRLSIEVTDSAPQRDRPPPSAETPVLDEAQLGGVLIRILMDEVESQDDLQAGTHTLRMVKYVGR